MNNLKVDQANKQKCKTCMFNYNEHSVELSPERMHEILDYLITLKNSHICHTTNKTCYGGMEIQARVLYIKGLIPEPTPECLMESAKEILFND